MFQFHLEQPDKWFFLIRKNEKNGSGGVLFYLVVDYWPPAWLKMTLVHGCCWFILKLKNIVLVPEQLNQLLNMGAAIDLIEVESILQ